MAINYCVILKLSMNGGGTRMVKTKGWCSSRPRERKVVVTGASGQDL